MAQFEINGYKYQSRMLPGEAQILIAKRLLGTLTVLAGTASQIAELLPKGRDLTIADLEAMSHILLPVAQEVSGMKDEDVNFILDACRDATERQAVNSTGWTPLSKSGDPTDRSFKNRLTVAWFVLRENFEQISSLIGLSQPQIAETANG